ncbi:fructose PTS transporter subunit IIA [Priestia filamentosa]|uniref:PTS sugar transporter subunit IIA n=1 Tax=Priestia filamentosa TaxID=1402861 RepID=UPI002E1C59CB|nr:fructose PTS transporter subunit IIA [Priestia filamentosa]MED3728323.1 fructose PTS transporter subunit IIA [Priestia filamentosa]
MIEKELLVVDEAFKNKEELIYSLSQKANELGKVSQVSHYMQSVLKREEECSTAIGFSVAIPHGKSESVKIPFVAFARPQPFIQWDNNEEEIKLVFLIGVPKEQEGTVHLKILANISRKLIDEEFRSSLLQAASKEELYGLLTEAVQS